MCSCILQRIPSSASPYPLVALSSGPEETKGYAGQQTSRNSSEQNQIQRADAMEFYGNSGQPQLEWSQHQTASTPQLPAIHGIPLWGRFGELQPIAVRRVIA